MYLNANPVTEIFELQEIQHRLEDPKVVEERKEYEELTID